jgi:hypothetical protein
VCERECKNPFRYSFQRKSFEICNRRTRARTHTTIMAKDDISWFRKPRFGKVELSVRDMVLLLIPVGWGEFFVERF